VKEVVESAFLLLDGKCQPLLESGREADPAIYFGQFTVLVDLIKSSRIRSVLIIIEINIKFIKGQSVQQFLGLENNRRNAKIKRRIHIPGSFNHNMSRIFSTA
jgi:hypothetical protein